MIGRFRQPTGHIEIVAYGTKGAVANSHELCTWIEYVPGYTMFGSCDAVSSVGKGHPVNVGLEAQIPNPKLGASTEVGGLLAPNVASVELRFRRNDRAKATVAQVSGKLQRRLKQPAPFGYFVAKIKGLVAAKAIEVRAYDARGRLLDSTSGRI